jgi:hypothetical protein
MIVTDATTSYEDAITAATNSTAWNVLINQPATVGGNPATLIEATSTTGSPGVAVGQTRFAYIVNVGGNAASIQTVGTVGDATFNTNAGVTTLIASQVVFVPTATLH